MHARLDSGSRLTSRALLAPSPGAGCREVCSLIASKRVSRIAAKGTVAKAPARSANTRIGCRPYKERLHSWNQCTVCGAYLGSHPSSASCSIFSLLVLYHPFLHGSGHADGILVCEACQGQGIVATKVTFTASWSLLLSISAHAQPCKTPLDPAACLQPGIAVVPSTLNDQCQHLQGVRLCLLMYSHIQLSSDPAACLQPGGAGVPFYIGNAQCSTCKGMGFEPCSVCIGYQAELPPPDPCNGPASRDPSDSRVTTRRWLQSFPDSRSTGRSSRQVTLMPFRRP